MSLPLVYVAHALSCPEREQNQRRAKLWAAWLAERYYLAPVFSWVPLSEVWDESYRELGLEIDRAQVAACAGVIWCGDRTTEGMRVESRDAHWVIGVTGFCRALPDLLTEEERAWLDTELNALGIRRRH